MSTPTPVACVPRSGAPRTSCLSAESSFAACCLLCASSFFNSVFCLRELLMHCFHSIFFHLDVSGTRCLSIESGPPTNTSSSSEAFHLQQKHLHQCEPQLSYGFHGFQLRVVLIVPRAQPASTVSNLEVFDRYACSATMTNESLR